MGPLAGYCPGKLALPLERQGLHPGQRLADGEYFLFFGVAIGWHTIQETFN